MNSEGGTRRSRFARRALVIVVSVMLVLALMPSAAFAATQRDVSVLEVTTEANGLKAAVNAELRAYGWPDPEAKYADIEKLTIKGELTDTTYYDQEANTWHDWGFITRKLSGLIELDLSGLTNTALPEIKYAGVSPNYYLFYGKRLKKVSLSEKITIIPASFFEGAGVLEEVAFPYGNNITTVSGYAFRNCSSLKSFDLSKVTSLGERYAFAYTDSLTDIGNLNPALTVIPDYTFRETAITSVDFDNVTKIGEYAFAYSKLRQADISKVKTNADLGANAFANSKELIDVKLSPQLTAIPDSAFYRCSGLRSINIESITAFGDSAFAECTRLDGVTFSQDSAKTFANAAFSQCALLLKDGVPTGSFSQKEPAHTNYPFYRQRPLAYLSVSPSAIAVGVGGAVTPPAQEVTTRDGKPYGELFDPETDYSAWLSPEVTTAPAVTSDTASSEFETGGSLTATAGRKTVSYGLSPSTFAAYPSVSFTVNVGDFATTVETPTATPITYGSILGASTIAGEVVDDKGRTVAGDWVWDEPDVDPPVGESTYAATFTPASGGGDPLGPVHAEVSVTVAKANPLVTVPTLSAIEIFGTLADTVIGDFTQTGVFGETLDGSWRLILPLSTTALALGGIGPHSLEIEYSPNNDSYNRLVTTTQLTVLPNVDAKAIAVEVAGADTLKAAVDAELISRGARNPEYYYPEIEDLTIKGLLSTSSDANNTNFANDWVFIRAALKGLATLDLSEIDNALIPAGTGAFPTLGSASLREVKLGGGLAAISGNAFSGCAALESINLEKVKSIGGSAFANCKKLEEVDLSGLDGSAGLGAGAFSGCTALETVDLSQLAQDGFKGESVFKDCSALSKVTLGTGITSLPGQTFRNCASLEEIDLSNVTSFTGEYTFAGSGLTSVDLSDAFTAEATGAHAFDGCASLANVTLGAIATVSDYAFKDCAALKSIGLNKVRSIGIYAFSGSGLTSIDLSGLAAGGLGSGAVNAYTFQNCASLVSVEFGTTLNAIPAYAFENCAALRSADLRGMSGGFGNYAFRNCGRLSEVSFPADSVTYGTQCFAGCALSFSKAGSAPAGAVAAVYANQVPLAYVALSADEGWVSVGEAAALPTVVIRDIHGTDYRALIDSKAAYAWMAQKAAMPTYERDSQDVATLTATAGVKIVTYSFSGTPTDKASLTYTLHVNEPGPNDLTAEVSATGITYGAVLDDSEVIGTVKDTDDNEVDGTWAWATPDARPSAIDEPHIYNATFTPEDTSIAQLTKGIAVTVAQAVPKADTPDRSPLGKGKKLLDTEFGVKLGSFTEEGIPGESITGVWSIVSPAAITRYNEPGIKTITLEYNPRNANYSTIRREAFLVVDEGMGIDVGTIPTSLKIEVTGANQLKTTVDKALRYAEVSVNSASYEKIKAISVSGPLSTGTINSASNVNDWYFMGQTLAGLEKIDLSGVTNISIPDAYAETYAPFSEAALEEVTLPDNLKTIGAYAFYHARALEKITLRKVTAIGADGFAGCTALAEVDLSSCESIGINGFSGCTKLAKADLPSCKTIGANGFSGCVKLEACNAGAVTVLGNYAFSACASLEEADLQRAESIGSYAFQGCTSLEKIDIVSVTSINSYAFYGCTKLKEAVTGAGGFASRVLNYGAFKDCASLEDIDLSTFTMIYAGAFNGCMSLKKIDLSGLTGEGITISYIDPKNPFGGCIGLEEIKWADKAPVIWANLFKDLPNLKTVDLNGAKEIGKDAFSGCFSLTEIRGLNSGTIKPDLLIGENAFKDCRSLTSIDLAGRTTFSGTSLGVRDANNATVSYVNAIGTPVSSQYAFQGCESLKTVHGLTAGVTELPEGIFSGTGLEELDLSGIAKVGAYAFAGCENLDTVTFPPSAVYGQAAFERCALLLRDGSPVAGAGSGSRPFKDQLPKAYLSLNATSALVYRDGEAAPPTVTILGKDGRPYAELFDEGGRVKEAYAAWLSEDAEMPAVVTSPKNVDYDALAKVEGDHVVTYSLVGPTADSGTADFTLIVLRAPELAEAPRTGALIYGQTLADATIVGGKVVSGAAVVDGAWAWAEPLTRPDAGEARAFAATFTAAGGAYPPVRFALPVNVAKAVPTVSAPTVGTVEYGKKLSDVVLGAFTQRGIPGDTLSGVWSFVLPGSTVLPVGAHNVEIKYDPRNANYKSVSATIRLTVAERHLASPSQTTYMVTARAGKGGSITASGSYAAGTDAVYRFTPDKGYKVASVVINGKKIAIPKTNSYTFKNISANQTIEVAFALKTFKISTSKKGKGTVTKSKAVAYGKNFTVKFKAAKGYKILKITVDGKKVKVKKSYTFKKVTKAHKIKVYYVKK
jgi:hypothetical protein